jgi:DNA-binding XRE family transcriptional regulator
MNKFLEAFNKQDKTYEAIGREIGLSESAIWRIITGDSGTRYKVAFAIGQQLGMSIEDIKKAWLELVNNIAEREISRYETAIEKPKIYPKTKKNRIVIDSTHKESKKPVQNPKTTIHM